MFSYKSDRSFVIFSYSASHGQLLLRSRKSNEYSTRVDILILDVRAIEMRCWFTGVKIEEIEQTYLAGRGSGPAEMIEPGNIVYKVKGENWEGFIVGGIAIIEEDDKEYGDPSGLLPAPRP